MPILTKEVEVRPSGKMIQYYRDLGYDAKYLAPLMVKVEDLSKGSKIKIEVLCDMCHKNKMIVEYASHNTTIERAGNHVCRECGVIKASQTRKERYGVEHIFQSSIFRERARQTCLERYGVEHASQSEEIKEKTKQTNLERYGAEYYIQTEECLKRIRQTNLERYGVENVFQSEEIQKKAKQTHLERYGVEYNMQLKESVEKRKNTYLEHYGFDNPMKHPDIKEKFVKSMYKNGAQKTSKQQAYLHSLYGGELNYPIKYYDVDICLLDENLSIEYDGSGHDLCVKFGQLTQEEFNQREIARHNTIKREGYKQIHIISQTDRLPSDSILLQMLLDAKRYFSTTNHTWINYDIDNSRMINAENKDVNGIFYDYGELRAIKEVAA